MSFGQIVSYRGYEGTESRRDSPATGKRQWPYNTFHSDIRKPKMAEVVADLCKRGKFVFVTG